MNKIPVPKISEILKDEFLLPLDLSAYALAKNIHVLTSRIQDILHDRKQITVDPSVRLRRFFGVSDRYFLNLQNDLDLRNAKEKSGKKYRQIQPYQYS